MPRFTLDAPAAAPPDVAKPVRGRPPKPPGEALSERVELRLSPAQLAKLVVLGGQQWVRERIAKAKVG